MIKIPPPQINKYYNNYIAISFAYEMIFFYLFSLYLLDNVPNVQTFEVLMMI